MAVLRTLSNPAVSVNDAGIGIVPNSLVVKNGIGDIVIRAQSSGGNSIQIIKTENAETKKGMVKFSVFNTKVSYDLAREWQDAISGVSIELSEGSFSASFRNMFLITDPEFAFGSDSTIELVFEGLPVK